MSFRQCILAAVLFFAVLTQSVSFAQSRIKVTIEFVDLKKETEQKTVLVKDSIEAEKYVTEQLYQLYFNGFLGAVVVNREWKSKELTASILAGEVYQLKNLRQGNIDPVILNAIGFKENKNRNAPFKFYEIEQIFRKILDYAEDSGYPFASIKLDSLEIDNREISAHLNLWSGPKVFFDSLILEGPGKIKESWLADFLDIRYGQLYKERSVRNIEEKLRKLKFAVLTADPEVVFVEDRARVVLELRERRINTIDGVVGFLPNAGADSRFLLTGNLNLHLYNLFSTAKQLHLDWQRVKANSQTLDFEFQYPRFLKTPIGIYAGLNLLKEDTVFFNRNFNIRLNFYPGPYQSILLNSELQSSRLTGNRSAAFSDGLKLSDFDINYYGVTYQINRLNHPFVATRGWFISVEGLAGRKNLILNSLTADSLNQNVELQSTQYKIGAHIENFIPITKNYVGRIRLTAGSVMNKNLFTNDLFRLGGLNSLRGFNENFFFVSQYVLGNFEFRIQGSEETYFFSFFDQAIFRNQLTDATDFPLGAGVGMSLSTGSGIFNFIFAMGKSQSQNFSINSAKIHFGYTGRF